MAWNAQLRLNQRYRRLNAKTKPAGKVITAVHRRSTRARGFHLGHRDTGRDGTRDGGSCIEIELHQAPRINVKLGEDRSVVERGNGTENPRSRYAVPTREPSAR